MSEGDLDKSDPASAYKLEKAREKAALPKVRTCPSWWCCLG